MAASYSLTAVRPNFSGLSEGHDAPGASGHKKARSVQRVNLVPSLKTSSGSHRAQGQRIVANAGVEQANAGVEQVNVPTENGNIQVYEQQVEGQGQGIIFGLRIPKDYFVARGFGETDAGGGTDPWETGSYDLALEDAGIMDLNIVPYTSVMSPEAREIPYEQAKKYFHHGAVLETIIAEMNGVQGDRLSAGVGRALVKRKSDGFVVGGYAAEYKGHAKTSDVEAILKEDLRNIFDRRFKMEEYDMFDEKYTIEEAEVAKGYGTVIACICFVTYIFPMHPATN